MSQKLFEIKKVFRPHQKVKSKRAALSSKGGNSIVLVPHQEDPTPVLLPLLMTAQPTRTSQLTKTMGQMVCKKMVSQGRGTQAVEDFKGPNNILLSQGCLQQPSGLRHSPMGYIVVWEFS